MDSPSVLLLVILILAAIILLSSEETTAPDHQDEINHIEEQAYHDAHSLSEEFLQMAIQQLIKKRR